MRLYRICTHDPTEPEITFTLQSFYGILGGTKLCAPLQHCDSPLQRNERVKSRSSLPNNEASATPSTSERTPRVAAIRHKGEFWEE